jgi:hypothetical protein
MRRRAYVESHMPFPDGVRVALRWAGDTAAIRVGDTGTVDENPWIEQLGIPITCASSRSRFYGRPRGTVIGVFLNLSEVLELERSKNVEGIVIVAAHGRSEYAPTVPGHLPWITAFDVEHLGGNEIQPLHEASPPLKAAINGLSMLAVLNQGLIDSRERSESVQTLTFLRDRGIRLEPDGLMVEALRNGWGGTGPEDLRQIAINLNNGKKLRFEKRIRPERLEEWARAEDE